MYREIFRIYIYTYIYIYESVRVEMATLITIVEMYAYCIPYYSVRATNIFRREIYDGRGGKKRAQKSKKKKKERRNVRE